MKKMKEYKEVIYACFILFVIVFTIIGCVIFIPSSTAVIVTDTGYVLERVEATFISYSNYKIFEETKTIVIIENGEYVSYKYNDWYMFDNIQGKSFFQKWGEN